MKKEGKLYKENAKTYIVKEANKQKWIKLKTEEYCYLDVVVYMNKKGRDADNLFKLIQDSITESNCVWEDDTYALSRTNRIYIDKNNPRVILSLKPTNTIGIFDNKRSYEEFKNKCEKCKSFNRNCKIHRQALENRIQEEIVREDMWRCLKFKERC